MASYRNLMRIDHDSSGLNFKMTAHLFSGANIYSQKVEIYPVLEATFDTFQRRVIDVVYHVIRRQFRVNYFVLVKRILKRSQYLMRLARSLYSSARSLMVGFPPLILQV